MERPGLMLNNHHLNYDCLEERDDSSSLELKMRYIIHIWIHANIKIFLLRF